MTTEEQLLRFVPRCPQEERDRREMLSLLRTRPRIYTREEQEAHFTASAWIVNAARSRVLLAYHNIYDSWAWTGGHADGEEELLAVALREAREETGLRRLRPVGDAPLSLEILPVKAHVKRGIPVAAHRHLNLSFLLEAAEDEPLTVKPDENSAVAWFDAAEVLSRVSEAEMRPIYEKLLRRQRD